MIDKSKFTSGKFWFTIITGFVFAYASATKILNGEQIYGVIMLIVAFYFNKPQDRQNGNDAPKP